MVKKPTPIRSAEEKVKHLIPVRAPSEEEAHPIIVPPNRRSTGMAQVNECPAPGKKIGNDRGCNVSARERESATKSNRQATERPDQRRANDCDGRDVKQSLGTVSEIVNRIILDEVANENRDDSKDNQIDGKNSGQSLHAFNDNEARIHARSYNTPRLFVITKVRSLLSITTKGTYKSSQSKTPLYGRKTGADKKQIALFFRLFSAFGDLLAASRCK